LSVINRIDIHVPDYNDSFSSVVLDGRQYLIRFSWNDSAGRWCFGLYTMQKGPIAIGIRIVPRFPLNLHIADERFPGGVFGVFCDLPGVGRYDFTEGRAAFAYISEQRGPA